MTWRTVAVIMIVVFAVIGVQSLLADPLVQTSSKFNKTVDADDKIGDHDVNALITGLPQAFLNMGLIMIFGLFGYGVWVVVRRELTRGQL